MCLFRSTIKCDRKLNERRNDSSFHQTSIASQKPRCLKVKKKSKYDSEEDDEESDSIDEDKNVEEILLFDGYVNQGIILNIILNLVF